MEYIIYKTTNLLTGKYYIGAHKAKELNDSYKGSGKVLKAAIKEHGSKNFVRETLEVCDNEHQMYLREAELVTLAVVADRNSYNIATGGKGGPGTPKSTEHKKAISKNHRRKSNPGCGRKPATDPVMLIALCDRIGKREAADELGISVEACRHRYYRMKNKV